MDACSAVGLAASIVQIINTTAQTIQYLKDVRDAPEERAQIQREADSLLRLLESLRDRVEHANQQAPWYLQICSLEGQGGPLDQYHSAMKALAKKLKPESGVKKLEKRLLWTFDKKQVKATLDLIERLKSLIGLALQGDQFELSLAVKIETHEVRDYISIMSKGLENVVESIAELKLGQEQAAEQYLDENQQKVLEWLSPLNFASKQVDAFERHQRGTGEWLFEEKVFKAWLAGDNNALWCSGIPGAGKTILTSIVVNHLECSYLFENNAVAVLYLSYRDQVEQSAKHLIGSLIRQVAHRKRTLSDDVTGLYHKHKPKGSRPTTKELSNLLYSEITHLSEVFILVDAMDECSVNNHTREDLLTTLQGLLEMPNVRLMITSRPVASIEAHLQGMAYLEIRAADEDIRKYVENRIPKERRLIPYVRGDNAFRVSIIDTIIAKAQGMFLMAQLHLGSLAKKNNKKDVRSALQRLPEKLDDTYAEAISRILSQDEEDVHLAKRTLMWISCAKRPLSIIELRHALAIKPGAKELDPESLPDKDVIVDVCSGLVAIDRESETIRLVHYTTQDYLVRVRTELFATAETDMTLSCVAYLLLDIPSQILDARKKDYSHPQRISIILEAALPFWSYAARFWGSHAREKAQYEAKMQHLILQLLEPNEVILGIIRSMPLRDKWKYYRYLYDVPGLHTAAYFDLTGLVDTLLDRGALVDAKDHRLDEDIRLTALHCAAHWGNVATLRVLLDRGASIDMPGINGHNLSEPTPLYLAASAGHQSIVELLLEKGADVDGHGEFGMTPLHSAASEGHQSIVALLLEKGADVDTQDNRRRTPLHSAASKGHQSVVELLLEKGADVDKEDRFERTPLYSAASKGHQSVVELLLEKGADVDTQEYCGMTPLYSAASKGHQSVVELLLDKGADVGTQDDCRRTPLHSAALKGHQSVVELLLDKGAYVDTYGEFGRTPLYLAGSEGHQSVVELLLEKGADVDVRMPGCDGKTPLHLAARWGEQSIVELLLEKGADVDRKDDCGRTPLYSAASEGHQSVVELLLEKGADVDTQDDCRRTPLHSAALKGHQSVVELLLDKGAYVDTYGEFGRTPLYSAASEGHQSVVELLLEKGADVDVQMPECDGDTPLHLAARRGKQSIVKCLIDAGADLEATMDYKGLQSTASDIAERRGHMAVFNLLQKAREQRRTLPTRNLTQRQNRVDEPNSPAD